MRAILINMVPGSLLPAIPKLDCKKRAAVLLESVQGLACRDPSRECEYDALLRASGSRFAYQENASGAAAGRKTIPLGKKFLTRWLDPALQNAPAC